MNSRRASVCLFLLGAFSMTQIHLVGNLGISELIVFVIAPFVFVQDYRMLHHDGFMPVIWLSLLSCMGCLVGAYMNGTPIYNVIRGFATTYSTFAIIVVGHRLVRQSPRGFKWLCLGWGLTWIINIFVFQRAVEADVYGGGYRGVAAVEGIIAGPLFWINRLSHLLRIPVEGWYLTTPTAYSIVVPIFLFFFAAITSASGRSAAAAAFFSAMLVVLAGKSRMRMSRLSKQIWLLLIMGLFLAQGLAYAYKTSARHGLLGENAQKKYEMQMTERNGGLLQTLMGGRLDFFVGAYSALHQPIVGYGPKPIDRKGYYRDFLTKYGTAQEVEDYQKYHQWAASMGYTVYDGLGGHSHIIGWWLEDGIFGFLFWCYVLFSIFRYFRYDLATVPQWYGMLAVSMPSMIWAIFFSPFGDRVQYMMILVYILMAKAIRLGRFHLPPDMICEMNMRR